MEHKPGPSTSAGDPDPQPRSSQGTVTWPSNEKILEATSST